MLISTILAYPYPRLSTLTITAGLLAATVFAQPGSNDPTFNIADLGFGNGEGVMGDVRGMALQPDGKVVVCGDFDRVQGIMRHKVARLNADGSIDPTFVPATDYDGYATAVALQPDGKLLVLGYFWEYDGDDAPKLLRLNSDGSLDPTFIAGGCNDLSTALTIQDDGKILVGGQFTFFNGSPAHGLVRLTSNGSLDPTFNAGSGLSLFYHSVLDIGVQTDGRILVAGRFTSFNGAPCNNILRLNSDGTVDATFDSGQGLEGDLSGAGAAWVYALFVQPNDQILVGGNFLTCDGTPRSGIARLNADGNLDGTFQPGTAADQPVLALALRTDGSVIIGGEFYTMGGAPRSGIARLLANGTLDPSFDPGVGIDVSWHENGVQCMALQPNEQVLIGGAFTSSDGHGRNRLTRLNNDGSTDAAFMPAGTGLNNTAYVVTMQPDGKALVGGAFSSANGVGRNRIARFNTDGSLDAAFDPGMGFNGYAVESITLQPDGKIIAGGEFTMFDGSAAPHLVRLNNDGSRDNTFDVGLGTEGSVLSSAVLANGKIMIAGNFSTVNGVSTGFVARLNSDGSHDPTFVADPLVGGYIPAMVVQPDGQVIVAGSLLARLNPDGSIDGSFTVSSTPSPGSSAVSLALRPDGKLLAAGGYDPGIMQVNADGSPDPTFNPGSGFDTHFDATPMVLQADGKVVVGGWYNTFNGVPRNSIARLNTDGSLDATFDPGSGANSFVYALALQADGKVIAAGNFIGYDGTGRNRIARLLTACVIGAACDDGIVTTGPDSYDVNCVCSGPSIDCLGTPNGTALPGTPCDDGSSTTGNDAYGSDCVCAGLLIDCTGIIGGGALPGSFCDDGNPATGNDIYDASCVCAGLLIDCEGVAGGSALPGTACNDGIATTGPDAINSACVCTGPLHFDSRPVAGGDHHTLTICSSQTVQAWGDNQYGQLGNGTFTNSAIPVFTQLGADPVAVAAGWEHSLVLCTDSLVRTWGYNLLGQLGNGGTTNQQLPALVAQLTGVVAIDGGGVHSLALRADGSVWVWGGGFFGQLGNGSTTNGLVPAPVPGLVGIVAISGGGYHSLALKDDGTVWAWGYNLYGQLGNGTFANSNVPVQVPGLTDIVEISAGFGHSFALATDGTMWSWGYNISGALADGSTSNSNVPIHITSLIDVSSVSCGSNHTVALLDDGTLWAWGSNPYGQVGNGTPFDQHLPVQIGTVPSVVFVAGGGAHSLAMSSDSSVWSWGQNNFGQLGNGTLVDGLVPAQVSGLCGPLVDCLGVENGSALPGTVCDDGLATTGNDVWNPDCICAGELIDCLGEPGGSALPGAACDDGNSATLNDAYTVDCICQGVTNACIPTQLTTTADPVISCGAVNLKLNGTSTIAATEVPSANKYQFRFTNITGQPAYSRNIAWPTRSFTLTKWYTNPLKAGRTYNVMVRASFDDGATWCDWGPSCTVKISWTPMTPATEPRDMDAVWTGAPELSLYPNPTNGDELNITLSDMDPELTSVSLDIMDLFGKRVMTSTLAVQDGELNTVLPLTRDLAVGLYVVTITAGDQVFNERLVIAR